MTLSHPRRCFSARLALAVAVVFAGLAVATTGAAAQPTHANEDTVLGDCEIETRDVPRLRAVTMTPGVATDAVEGAPLNADVPIEPRDYPRWRAVTQTPDAAPDAPLGECVVSR